METKVKELSSFKREIKVSVGWDDLMDDYNKEVKKAQSTFDMKGFRKGFVPINIVKNRIGHSIDAHFAENSLNKFYTKALEELSLIPINQAKIKHLDFKEGSKLKFTAEFEISPKIGLPKFEKKFKIQTNRYIVSENDVNNAIREIREKHSKLEIISDGAKNGHFIHGDFQEIDQKDNPLEGRNLKNQYIKLGEAAFSGKAEKPFIGAKSKDMIKTTVKYDKDKEVSYLVSVHKVEEQILPELNDDFVKLVDNSLSNVKELLDKTKKQIQESLDKSHKNEIQNEVIGYFVKNSRLDAPDSMVENYLTYVVNDMIEKNNKKEKINEEKIKETYRDQAINSVKWYLIKDKLIDLAQLDVSDDSIQEKIKELISENRDKKNQIKKFYEQSSNKEKLFENMLAEKLFDYLEKFVINKVVEKNTDELKKGKK